MVKRTEGNVIYVDFVLNSMIKSIEQWYKAYYQYDHKNVIRKAHVFHLVRFYDDMRFNNHKTLGEERTKYLEEVDLYVQMRRDE